ncbi:hypothetical protein [Roseovarius sp. ZX-A-9]|uniref:hypothetical protein n=1 Tax=Roseovarius sp. ZX-A-9 TaxID=3014783 RepID=UPI00232EC7CD|nr:hypothetical protein [Roseovarius sp. ZX-A-9]
MSARALRPLLASYGGGHVQIVAALARAFAARRDAPDIIGFTTAHAELGRQGIAAQPVSALLDPAEDAEWVALAGEFTTAATHPDIPVEETRAYFALGLRDLAQAQGREAALARVRREGRTAFEPVNTMRRYLRWTRPDIVITTTSPRFECALQKAARLEGIPGLAVGDLFLVKDRAWILQEGYAPHLAVLSAEVARALVTDGFDESGIRVTGNPAFDRLAPGPGDAARRDVLRARLGLDDRTVILFPAPGAQMSMIGRPFLQMTDVVASLEDFCRGDPRYAYLIRAHPNRPMTLPGDARYGMLDDGSLLGPEDAILVADVVCVEASTMGLQAALTGKPVICVGFADYVLYPEFGLGRAAADMAEAVAILRAGQAHAVAGFEMPPLGSASANVLAYVDEILLQHADSNSPNQTYGEAQ